MRQYRVVSGKDAFFANWAHKQARSIPIHYEAVFGIVNSNGEPCGAFMYNNYNYSDIEVHYYGPGSLKRYIFTEIMRRALLLFRCNRMTVKTRKASMARGVQKLGAVFEGTQRRIYGPTDGDEHAAQVYVFYRETMEELGGLKEKRHVLQS